MSYLDGAALAFFIVSWSLMHWLISASPWRTLTLSYAMNEHRRYWMKVMATRSNRIADTNVINGLQQSNSFFASTALLAVGAGFGLLTAADTIISAFEQSFVHVVIDRSAFYVKTGLLMALYAYAFFKFGWAYRLYNYSGIMLIATPDVDPGNRDQIAMRAAEMNIEAAGQFAHGLRAFFLAIAVLAWFISAWTFALATVLVVAALLNRQFRSRARITARSSVRLYSEGSTEPDMPASPAATGSGPKG